MYLSLELNRRSNIITLLESSCCEIVARLFVHTHRLGETKLVFQSVLQ